MKAEITKLSSGSYKWKVGHFYGFSLTRIGAIRQAKRYSIKYKENVEEIDLLTYKTRLLNINIEDIFTKLALIVIVGLLGFFLLIAPGSNNAINNSNVLPITSPTPIISESIKNEKDPISTPVPQNTKDSDSSRYNYITPKILPIPGGAPIGNGLYLHFGW